jgi:hypothetical protein
MKKILIVILLLIAFPCQAQMLQAICGASGAVACTTATVCTNATTDGCGNTVLLCEDFDGASSCYTSGPSNCWNTWTQGSGDANNFSYATSPAPLEGSYSLLITEPTSGYTALNKSFSASSTVNAYILFKPTIWEGNSAGVGGVSFSNSTGATEYCSLSKNANETLRLSNGTVTADGSTVLSTSHAYTIWVEYVAGSGSNGVSRVYLAVDSTTKPGSPEVEITNGDATASPVRLNLWGFYLQAQVVIDHIRVSTSSIGSNPP